MLVHRILQFLFLAPIRFYQIVISPLTPCSCRFQPTCSQYAIDAIKTFGILRGTVLATKRILRCHPWGDYGFDPLPDKNHSKTTNPS